MLKSKHLTSVLAALERVDVEAALQRTTDRIAARYGDAMNRIVRAWWQANAETGRVIDEIALSTWLDWLLGPPKQPPDRRTH